MKSPKLLVNSSIFIENGVKKASERNSFSVWKIAKYISNNAIGNKLSSAKSSQIK